MKMSSIVFNDYNANVMNDHQYQLLKSSIKEEGIKDTIRLRPLKKKFEIVDGEHRARAAQELGIKEIPDDKIEIMDLNRAEAILKSMSYNSMRGTLDPLREALNYKALQDEEKSLDWIAQMVGKDKSWIWRRIEVVNNQSLLRAAQEGKISVRKATEIVYLKNPLHTRQVLVDISDKKLSLKEIRILVKIYAEKEDRMTKQLEEAREQYVEIEEKNRRKEEEAKSPLEEMILELSVDGKTIEKQALASSKKGQTRGESGKRPAYLPTGPTYQNYIVVENTVGLVTLFDGNIKKVSKIRIENGQYKCSRHGHDACECVNILKRMIEKKIIVIYCTKDELLKDHESLTPPSKRKKIMTPKRQKSAFDDDYGEKVGKEDFTELLSELEEDETVPSKENLVEGTSKQELAEDIKIPSEPKPEEKVESSIIPEAEITPDPEVTIPIKETPDDMESPLPSDTGSSATQEGKPLPELVSEPESVYAPITLNCSKLSILINEDSELVGKINRDLKKKRISTEDWVFDILSIHYSE